jgi:hypothetical protein
VLVWALVYIEVVAEAAAAADFAPIRCCQKAEAPGLQEEALAQDSFENTLKSFQSGSLKVTAAFSLVQAQPRWLHA